MLDLVTSDIEGVELAKALGIPVKGLVKFEIKAEAGKVITAVADYLVDEEGFSKFFTLCDKFVAKENINADNPE